MNRNGPQSRPILFGDRVRLCGEADGAFTEYAVVGTVSGRGLAVVLLAAADVLLAPVFAYPGGSLVWHAVGGLWTGPLPPDRSGLILSR